MQTRSRDLFTTIHVEGAILPPELLQRIAAGDSGLESLSPDSYHLIEGEKINEVTSRSWNRLLGAWTVFQEHLARLPEADPATSLTRERWLLHLFRELGYGRLAAAHAVEINGKSYAVSHAWQGLPIHLIGWGVDLDRRSAGIAGATRSSPHSMVQELLNRSEDLLWAFLSNGRRLRILRDNVSLTRQAWVEFDLEAMMRGEIYADFVLLWLLCHQSRVEASQPELCILERWSRTAQELGTRALDQLRSGVESAIATLGSGFLRHPGNRQLSQSLFAGELDKQDYYRQLLRLVYRLIFLFVAEERQLLLLPEASSETRRRYYEYYSTQRLRRLALRRRGSRHADLYQGLTIVMRLLGGEHGAPGLGLPALGSFLFSGQAAPDLETAQIANRDLLQAIRHLAVISDGRSRRQVDYRNLGAEELGSIYESLLELHPRLNLESGDFSLHIAGGHERKSTGSYYTPSSLIQELLDSALEPVLTEAARQPDPEAAILALRVCDPACGSGHFLIAAAHRIAHRLAAVVSGESEPAPEALRAALRRVIGRCIYGVDINEMAVELCRVGLWLEALEPGKPLSFLDHHIQCGNSLLGATPELIAAGIPDEAFMPIEGDDKALCTAAKRLNKKERETAQADLFYAAAGPWQRLGDFAGAMVAMDRVSDETLSGYRSKSHRYQEIITSPAFRFGRLVADLWCAAFVWRKTGDSPYLITTEVLRTIEAEPGNIPNWMYEEVERLRQQYNFFHWHLTFPEVFSPEPAAGAGKAAAGSAPAGGFDVILGNPPWERIKLQEKEWFAERHPGIADAANAAQRRRMIEDLQQSDPAVYKAFVEDRRQAEGESMLVRSSGRYPLCGRGDVNTYTIFTELNRTLINPDGRVGCIVPSGIATDDTTKFFFQDLIARRSLVSLYDFENRDAVFIGVHRSYKFCLLTLTGSGRPNRKGAEFLFFAHQTADLKDAERRFILTAEDIALLNPNTRTCPIFRGRRDAELTRYIYRRVPVMFDVNKANTEDRWKVEIGRMFHASDDSPLFTNSCSENTLRLYEAKCFWFYDHRYATWDQTLSDYKDVTIIEKQNPRYHISLRYCIKRNLVPSKFLSRLSLWYLSFRNITNATNERTLVASITPESGLLHSGNNIYTSSVQDAINLLSCMNSIIVDFCVRQKIGGLNLSYGILSQLPIFPPCFFNRPVFRSLETCLANWLLPRVLELVYTSNDLAPFARDCGHDGPPFKWDEERRFQLRCELDAAFFHLYLGSEQEWRDKATPELLGYFPSPRDAVAYIMETFPIVKRKDEQAWHEYRTLRVILEYYERMAAASKTLL